MINDLLKKIKEAIYGEEVRNSIHDAIEQCYKDATGHPESVAATVKEIGEVSKRIDNLIATGTAQSQEVGKTIATTSQGSKTKINFSDSNVIYTSAFDTVKISDSLFARIDEDDGSPLQILKEGLYYLNASVEIKSEESTIPATAYMILLEMTDEQYNKIGSPIRRVIDFPSNPTFNIERQQISYLFKADKKTNLRFIVSSIADTSDKLAFSIDDIMLTALDWKGKQSADLSELHDLRIGADGTVYDTSGQAMREQIGSLKEDIAKSDLAVDTITPNVLSATKYDGKEITSDVINEIYNHNGGTYDLTQKLKPTDKVIPRLWFDDGTYLPEISGLVLILQDDNNETVEQIIFGRENDNSLENATKAFLLNYNATSLTPFAGKVIKGITLEYKDFSDKYYGSKEKYSPTIDDLKKNVKLLDVVIPNILMNSEYNGEQFTQNVIDEMYNNTIDISLNEQIKGKIIPNILFNDGTNIGNVSGYVARIYSGSTLIEEVTLGNESAQDLSTATMIKFKTYRNDSASEYIGKNIFCFSATISDYAQKYKPYELESKRIQKLESELTVKNQIVCFGDSLTQGAGGNGISYPSVLKGLVGDNYSVINQGSGGENTIAILSRQGSVATYVNNIIIPANNKTAVKLCQPNEYLESNLGINSLLTIAGDMTGINPCCINGVIGNLLKVDDSNGTYYTFTRRNDGKEIVIDRPTRIFFYSTDKYNHSILCLFIGQNGGYSTEEELVEQIRNAIRHNGSDKYIILGLTTGSNTERASLEKTMQNAFGLHYLNTRKYLYMYGLSDANIKPTTQDEDDIKNGIVPTSLRSDSVHLNNKGYTVLGNIVYKKGVELGYW